MPGSDATLQCYLDIAEFFSLVFNDPLTRADGERILRAPAKAPAAVQFDEKALAAWLNFANGAITFDTLDPQTARRVEDDRFAEWHDVFQWSAMGCRRRGDGYVSPIQTALPGRGEGFETQ